MLKQLLMGALGTAGIPALMHKLLRKKGVTILTYHGVTASPLPFEDWCFLDQHSFEQQIRYLSRYHRILSLSDALQLLDAGEVTEPTAVITFDDGYRNNLTVALPILQRYNAPATIYLSTDLIGTTDTLWFCRLNQALAGTTLTDLSWNGLHLPLNNAAAKSAASARLQNALKGMPNARLLAAVDGLITQLGGQLHPVQNEASPYRMLDLADIQQLQRTGLIEFGAHTCSHAILARLDSHAQREEISGSKAAVEALTGQPCVHFAYPNGSIQDHDPDTVAILREAGFVSCTNMRPGSNVPATDRMHLHRYGIGADTEFSRFKLWSHHIR